MIAKKLPNYSYEIEKVENYKKAINDTTQTWILHHRFEIEYNLSAQDLKNLDLYYNRPANELIFLTKLEHYKLHFSRKQTEEHRKRISEAKKGKRFSEEHRRKLSEAHKKLYRKHWVHLDEYGIITAETWSAQKPACSNKRYWISEEEAIRLRKAYHDRFYRKDTDDENERIKEFLEYYMSH